MDSWFEWLDLERPQAIFTVLLSVLIPLSIFVGRRNVRVRRLRLLDNLERVLFPAGGARRLPPGFDMIRARYLGAENAYAMEPFRELAPGAGDLPAAHHGVRAGERLRVRLARPARRRLAHRRQGPAAGPADRRRGRQRLCRGHGPRRSGPASSAPTCGR